MIATTMAGAGGFGQTENVAITILVDNRADLMVKSTETVKAFTDEPLLAEHGFAALVDLRQEGTRILWDAGISSIALPENMARMKIEPKSIDAIALSHGHADHTAALTAVIQAMALRPESRDWEPDTSVDEMARYAEGHRVPVVAHPAAFRERWAQKKKGGWRGPIPPPACLEWEAAGAAVILSEGPYQLGPGCWTTGAVPRRSFERSGIQKRLKYRQGDVFHTDLTEEDQAIAINVRGKGLVVLSGCAHSGIVNTINQAREISGVERVWAVLGGFHLASASDEEVERTIEEIKKLELRLVSPTHCTGFGPICRFATEMPEAFVPCTVGMSFLF